MSIIINLSDSVFSTPYRNFYWCKEMLIEVVKDYKRANSQQLFHQELTGTLKEKAGLSSVQSLFWISFPIVQ